MQDEYYINLVEQMREVTEEYTLSHGYKPAPSTSFTGECGWARGRMSDLESKLGHFNTHLETYSFQRLEHHDRNRWEFEFDRLYEEYIQSMEEWLERGREYFDYSLADGSKPLPDSEAEPAVRPQGKMYEAEADALRQIAMGLLILIGLVIGIGSLLIPQPETAKQEVVK